MLTVFCIVLRPINICNKNKYTGLNYNLWGGQLYFSCPVIVTIQLWGLHSLAEKCIFQIDFILFCTALVANIVEYLKFVYPALLKQD